LSKVFSLVGLETNTGIRDAGIMSGVPEVEDIQNSDLYKELVEDCGCSDYITVIVKSYRWGEGEPEDMLTLLTKRISSTISLITTSAGWVGEWIFTVWKMKLIYMQPRDVIKLIFLNYGKQNDP
jgi:hypothetical protein